MKWYRSIVYQFMLSSKNQSTDRSGKLPLHVQVSEMLAREIQAGMMVDGTRLPPERELAQDLDIAVGTLRKALADLTEKGLLERVQGSGNYVRNRAEAKTIYGFFRLELLSGGGLPTADLLDVKTLQKPKNLPTFGQSQLAHRIRRQRFLNGEPIAVEEIWLDGSYCETLEREGLSDSLYQHYRQNLNLWINRAEDSVSVAAPPDWKPKTFVSNFDIWGYVERLSFDQNNLAAEYSRTWFDPATARYVARLK